MAKKDGNKWIWLAVIAVLIYFFYQGEFKLPGRANIPLDCTNPTDVLDTNFGSCCPSETPFTGEAFLTSTCNALPQEYSTNYLTEQSECIVRYNENGGVIDRERKLIDGVFHDCEGSGFDLSWQGSWVEVTNAPLAGPSGQCVSGEVYNWVADICCPANQPHANYNEYGGYWLCDDRSAWMPSSCISYSTALGWWKTGLGNRWVNHYGSNKECKAWGMGCVSDVPSTPSPEFGAGGWGEVKCEGSTLYRCEFKNDLETFWVGKGENSYCLGCATGDTRCDDANNYYTCDNSQWVMHGWTAGHCGVSIIIGDPVEIEDYIEQNPLDNYAVIELIGRLDASSSEKAGYIDEQSQSYEDYIQLIAGVSGTTSERIEIIGHLNIDLQTKLNLVSDMIVSDLTLTLEGQAQLILEYTDSSSEMSGIIENLDLTIGDQAQMIIELTDSFEEMANIIDGLDLEIGANAQLITKLTDSTSEQADIIEQMELTIGEQAMLKDMLASSILESESEIAGLSADIQAQAQLIQELTDSTQEIADMIAALDLTIGQQAELISALTLSTSEQADVISNLQMTIGEQAQVIDRLTSSTLTQANIIDNMQLTIGQQAQLIGELTNSIVDQADIINGLQLTVGQQAQLISELTDSVSTQADIISNMQLTIAEQAALITELTNSRTERAEIIDGLQLDIDGQLELVIEIEDDIDDQTSLIAALARTIAEQQAMIAMLEAQSAIKAELIANRQLSFEEMAQRISESELALFQYADVISSLGYQADEIGMILDAMELESREQAKVINTLELTKAEIKDVIGQIDNSLDEQARLLASLELEDEEKQIIIDSLSLSLQDKSFLERKLLSYQEEIERLQVEERDGRARVQIPFFEKLGLWGTVAVVLLIIIILQQTMSKKRKRK